MKLFRAAIISAAFVAIGALSYADPAPTIHYAPVENLEHVDVALIDTARREIDLAAYVLTDCPVMQALTRGTMKQCELSKTLSNRSMLELGRLNPTCDGRRRTYGVNRVFIDVENIQDADVWPERVQRSLHEHMCSWSLLGIEDTVSHNVNWHLGHEV
jgi:hypothetical protein